MNTAGGGYDYYKKRWAPECGQYMKFTVDPDINRAADRVSRLTGTAAEIGSSGMVPGYW